MDTNDYLTAFGKAVRSERQRAGLSQEDLAEQSGLHRTYIGGIERGERNPTLLTTLRIATALGVVPSSLLRSVDKRVRP